MTVNHKFWLSVSYHELQTPFICRLILKRHINRWGPTFVKKLNKTSLFPIAFSLFTMVSKWKDEGENCMALVYDIWKSNCVVSIEHIPIIFCEFQNHQPILWTNLKYMIASSFFNVAITKLKNSHSLKNQLNILCFL